jgi:hypothetical protein
MKTKTKNEKGIKMMTKKDFQNLARELSSKRPPASNKAAYKQWAALVSGMIEVCRQSNPKFDTEKFLLAIDRDGEHERG